MIKYYAFVIPAAVGIFTKWSDVEVVVSGTKGAQHKSFYNYNGAQMYVMSLLSDADKQDFGLNKNKLYLNKKFIRKQQYTVEKEAAENPSSR